MSRSDGARGNLPYFMSFLQVFIISTLISIGLCREYEPEAVVRVQLLHLSGVEAYSIQVLLHS